MDPNVAARGIGSQWDDVISYAASSNGLPVSLIKAVISQESAWNPNAINPADPSYGLMQINTRAHPEITPQSALNPQFNITWASSYLADRINRYGLEGGISAYNAGRPISSNRPYVDNVLVYKAWFEANDPASGAGQGGGVLAGDGGGILDVIFPPPQDLTPAVVDAGDSYLTDPLLAGGVALAAGLLIFAAYMLTR